MTTKTERRDFLRSVAGLAGLLSSLPLLSGIGKRKKIVLRSSWQTVNIGDIGHTPGVLTIFEKYFPEAEVRLWPSSVGNGVKEILEKRFPNVKIINTPEAVNQAFDDCDFLLHGSGPFLVARRDVERWYKETGKPYGIYGITFPGFYGKPTDTQLATLDVDKELLTKSEFVFFRDSPSLEYAKEYGVRCPIMEFGPDGAFAVDLKNEKAADALLERYDLKEGNFLCVIPRQRYTPYWEVKGRNTPFDSFKHSQNEKYKEQDNGPLREAIMAVLKNTDLKILICPEDETHVKFGKEVLYDPLPDKFRSRVAWLDRYWLTDEALSTYTRSAGLFGLEMHSPIMCIGQGVPAIVCRFTEQTTKGIMWKDIGLNDWLFDMDNPADVEKIVPTVLELARNPEKAKAKAMKAQKLVEQRQQKTMDILNRVLK